MNLWDVALIAAVATLAVMIVITAVPLIVTALLWLVANIIDGIHDFADWLTPDKTDPSREESAPSAFQSSKKARPQVGRVSADGILFQDWLTRHGIDEVIRFDGGGLYPYWEIRRDGKRAIVSLEDVHKTQMLDPDWRIYHIDPSDLDWEPIPGLSDAP